MGKQAYTFYAEPEFMENFNKDVEAIHGGKVHGARGAEIIKALENHMKLMEAQKK